MDSKSTLKLAAVIISYVAITMDFFRFIHAKKLSLKNHI